MDDADATPEKETAYRVKAIAIEEEVIRNAQSRLNHHRRQLNSLRAVRTLIKAREQIRADLRDVDE
jgi:hypothetical protein